MTNTLSIPVAQRAQNEFLRVLDTAVYAYELKKLNLVSLEHEVFISRKVQLHLYEPVLPSAGDRERHMIKRFEKLAARRDWDGHVHAFALARAFKKLLPEDPRNPGGHYVRYPLTVKANKAGYEWAQALRESAVIAKLYDQVWFAEQLLLGIPVSCSNFRMECLLLLRNSEGVTQRLVRLINTEGEISRGPNPRGWETLDARAFSGVEKFSEWLLARGNFVWHGSVTELRKLQLDISKEAAWRVINQVSLCGWLPIDGKTENGLLPGLWCFGDCMYANGSLVRPDANGIYWYNGTGYYPSGKGRESDFLQGRPSLKPDRQVSELLNPSDWINQPSDTSKDALLATFFREICQRLTESIGGPEALLALGEKFAYAAAPEIFQRYGLFPGLFIHGQKGAGKTRFTSWLLTVWGIRMNSGISLTEKTSSPIGMLQQLENYSNLPVWFDEFRDYQIDPGKLGVIRSAVDRSAQAKWTIDGRQREIRTAPIVSGETTASDSATRSRYLHVQVSAKKRKANHLSWLTVNSENFFLLGRTLMERRAEFVRLVFQFLEFWQAQSASRNMEARENLIYGIGYSSWVAMTGLLQSHSAAEVSEFKQFMLAYSHSAASDVASDTNINAFTNDLITATLSGAIPLNCFRLDWEEPSTPPRVDDVAAENESAQDPLSNYRLYFDVHTTIAHLKVFMAKQHGSVALNQRDLCSQLSVEPYWIPRKSMHFPGIGTIRPLGINVSLHPLGLQTVSTEVYTHFRQHPGECDPRKGRLFAVIDKILEAEDRKSRGSKHKPRKPTQSKHE